jgi:drug efflux transport system ATP-binding protein
MNAPILTARGITRRFGTLTAVDHLDLEVLEGEIFGLVGPDGAGKTTTVRLLCGLIDPSEGEATVAGHNVQRELDSVKDHIGYMAQRFGLYGDLTVNENMDFYAELFGVSREQRSELLPRLLHMTRMEPFGDRPAAKLSGGMKQKLALMCTLLHRPRILFLDEPTNGVDPVSRRDFWAILYQLAKDGITVFITTAYLDEAERCNRLGFLDRGRLIQVGTPAEMKSSLEERCYQIEGPRLREVRERLQKRQDVLSVEPSGATLRLFTRTEPEAFRDLIGGERTLHLIEPSLEDVFIALVRKNEAA